MFIYIGVPWFDPPSFWFFFFLPLPPPPLRVVPPSMANTPLPTPTHKYNAWADGRKSMGITPRPPGKKGEGEEGGDTLQFTDEAEREEWEEEQKVREGHCSYCICTCACICA